MPDVEFVTGDGDETPEDEELDSGPGRRPPRWLGPLVAVLVVAAVVAVVLVRAGGSEHTAQPTPSASAPNLPVPIPSDGSDGAPSGPIADLVVDTRDQRVVALVNGRLLAFDRSSVPVAESSGPELGQNVLQTQLDVSYDPEHNVIWVVRQGLPLDDPGNPRIVDEFDARSLLEIGQARLPAPATGATVLDGRLWIIASGIVYSLGYDSTTFRRVADVGLDAATPIADPSRHRLLFDQFGARLRLGALSAQPPYHTTVSAPLPFGGGEVAVVGSTIWAGGTATHGAVVTRLDPHTLQPEHNLAPALGLGASVVIEGTGARSLFVRPVQGSSETLLCLDGRSGALRDRFDGIVGPFAAVGGRGFTGATLPLVLVGLGRCPG